MTSTEIICINFTGGIVSPGYLKEVLEIAALAKVTEVRFGLRQQLILAVSAKYFHAFSEACAAANIHFKKKKEALPNIVSSYPAGIFTADGWLREGIYKDIFNSFNYAPKVRINICDGNQNLVPFFTGHINWVSSASANFWYLYVRFPNSWQVHCFSDLIYTNDIAAVSQQVEKWIASKKITTANELYQALKSTLSFTSKPIEKSLEFPAFSLPYYEGFNKCDNNYWLGIYRRDETFPLQFLLDVCTICLQTKIGQVYTTPWKSLIIKGIENTQKNLWDYVLGKYRINVRHAANELNWQIEDNCEEGLQLKRHIIRHFDKEDVRTYGVSFAVKTRAFSSMFGSVIIRKQDVKNPGRLKALERFEILYTADFNPNTCNFILYRKDVEKEHLGIYLVSLCKYFYEQENAASVSLAEPFGAVANTVASAIHSKKVYQCLHCFTVYDEESGDSENDIVAGTSFNNLPETYKCSLCEAGKEDFRPADINTLSLQQL